MGLRGLTLTGDGRRPHYEGLQFLNFASNIVPVIKSRRIRWVGHVARMGEKRGVYRVLVGLPDGKIQFGSPGRRWEATIEVDFQEVKWEAWTGFSWLRLGRELL